MKKINLFLLFVMLAGLLFQPNNTASAMDDVATRDALTPAAELLNPDGTLRLDGDFSGSLDLAGWDVTMDPERGPLLAPEEKNREGSRTITEGQWSSLGSGGLFAASLDRTVLAIAINGTDVYVGGMFTNVNNNGTTLTAADNIAKWDGANWSALGDDGYGNGVIIGTVRAIVVSGNDVYAGGDFVGLLMNSAIHTEGAYFAKYNTSTNQWSSIGAYNGNAALNDSVYTIAIHGSDFYLGGLFTNVVNVNGVVLTAADYLVKWDGANWSALGNNGAANNGSLNGRVEALTFIGSDLYAGGWFTDVNNAGSTLTAADYIAHWDGSNWSALGNNGAGGGSLDWNVFALGTDGIYLYVGGSFANVNNNGTVIPEADYIAKWDGSNWSALGSNGNGDGVLSSSGGYVFAIAVSGSNVYVGGGFTDIKNSGTTLTAADYVAHWDGNNWYAIGSNGAGNGSLNNYVRTLASSSQALYVGGDFTDVNDSGVILSQADYVAAYGLDVTPPNVVSITRANNNPTSSAIVDYTVIFSEPVTGVGFDDFGVYSVGLTGSLVYSYGGSGDTYLVRVATGTGNGTTQLILTDNDTIVDTNGNPLGGAGAGNGDLWGETYTVNKTMLFRSQGGYDGWTLEKSENANLGGSLNRTATTLRLGDDKLRKQYRSVLSFSTKGLPDNAVITKVLLKVKRQGIVGGGNPVTLFQGIYADMRRGFFSSSAGLQVSDFQARYTTRYKTYGPFKPGLLGGWYTLNLTSGKNFVNKFASNGGVTQIRLRFKLDDNNNGIANMLSLYSGNAPLASRPKLIIEYYTP